MTDSKNIPDLAECFRLMDEFAMLPNIRRHSIIVARVAWQLVDGLHEKPRSPAVIADRDLVVAGALLHDIAKTACLDRDCDHAGEGAKICLELGYPEIAEIVAEHVLLRDHDANRRRDGLFSAREIIYYADKRVRHEEIVSLDERLEYILEHYGQGDPDLRFRIRKNFNRCLELEQSIFSFLSFDPEQLPARVMHVDDDPVSDFLLAEDTWRSTQAN